MKRSIPPRLRASVVLAVGMVVVLAIGSAVHGWSSVIDVAPVAVIVVAALYVAGGRDSDTGALIRRQLDERQEYQRLRTQALVGRALSAAVAIAYLVASATKATLWPWAGLLGVTAVSFVAGRLRYGDRASGGHDGAS